MELIATSKLKPHPVNSTIYEDKEDLEFEASIQENGILQPLIVTGKHTILSGHRRWLAAKKFDIAMVPIEYKEVENEVIAIIELNRYRKKTMGEIYEESRALKAELAKTADVKMKAGKSADGKAGGRGNKANPPQTRGEGSSKKHEQETNAMVARKVGTNRETLRKVEAVLESDLVSDEDKKKLRRDEVPLDRAYRNAKKLESIQAREQRRADAPKAKSKFEPELMVGECIELMKKMPHNSVKLIFTDPPYAISSDDKMTMVGDSIENAQFGEWDVIEEQEYRRLMKNLVKEAQRILTPDGSFYCFCDRLFTGELFEMLKEVKMIPKNVMVWKKTNPTPNARRNFSSATEFFVFATKSSKYTWNEKDADEMENVAEYAKSTGNDRKDFPHTTQKPKDLVKRYIEISSNEGDMVLDPFGGSGTTAAAAYPLKRKCIIIERDKAHAKTIKQRVALMEEPES